jgi:hypothetical protein
MSGSALLFGEAFPAFNSKSHSPVVTTTPLIFASKHLLQFVICIYLSDCDRYLINIHGVNVASAIAL